LDRLGLRRIADLAKLPRAALAKRFGPSLLLRLDQVMGHAAEALSPLLPQPPRYVRLDLAEPIAEQSSLLHAIDVPLSRLVELLRTSQIGIRRLELACYLLNGETRRLAIGTALPSLEARHLRTLLAERMEEFDCGEGIEALRLSALIVDPLETRQDRLDQPERDPSALPPLIDRLDNRLGGSLAYRPTPRESHVPERAVARLPPLAQPPRRHWPRAAHRPLRLLAHPEPIAVLAPIPDDPPVQFRWRRTLHRVRAAEGPERIEPEWWLQKDAGAEPRDYYRVEDFEGRRFWLYRAGLYRADRPARWFLHGLFA
jgi:protein ImuB